MQASFTDLVGTAMHVHGIPCAELTELTPALDATAGIHELTQQASEAENTGTGTRCSFCC